MIDSIQLKNLGALTYVLNVRFSYGVVRPAAGPEAVKSGVKTGHHLRIVDYDTGDGNALWYKLSGKVHLSKNNTITITATT